MNLLNKFKNRIKNKYIKASLSLLGFQYVFFTINLLGQILLIRELNPEVFGEFAVVLSIVTIINMIMSLSVSVSYIRQDYSPTLFSSAMFIQCINWFVIFLITLLVCVFINGSYNEHTVNFIIIMTAFKLFEYVRNVIHADMERNLKFSKAAIIIGLSSSGSLLCALILAKSDYYIYALLAREVLLSITSFVLTLLLWHRKEKICCKLNFPEIKELIQFSFRSIFARASEAIFMKSPILICEKLYGTTATGLFNQSIYLALLMNNALSPFTQKVAFVYYSKNKGNINKASRASEKINVFISLLLMPVLLAIYFFAFDILNFLWGNEWVGATPYLRNLIGFMLFFPIYHNIKSLLFGLGKQISVGAMLFISFLVFIVGVWFIQSAEQIPLVLSFSMALAVCLLRFVRKIKYDHK
mgnify:FL=1